MKQILYSISERKREFLTNNQDTSKEFNLYNYMLENANVLYFPEKFNFERFYIKIDTFLKDILKLSSNIKVDDCNKIVSINYREQSSIKKSLGFSGEFILYLCVFERQLLFLIRPQDWISEIDKKKPLINIQAIIQDSYEEKITRFITDEMLNEVLDSYKNIIISDSNKYINDMSVYKKIFFYCEQQADELLLMSLNISTLKTSKSGTAYDNTYQFSYLGTSKNTLLVGFDSKGEIILYEDISSVELQVRDEIGRNTVIADTFQWLTDRDNAKQFLEINYLSLLEEIEKIREIARLNFLYYNKKSSLELLDYLINKYKNPFDEFLYLYAGYDQKNNIFSAKSEDNVIEILKKLLEHPECETELVKNIDKWKIPYIEQSGIINLLLQSATNTEHFNRILPLHRKVRETFLKKNKDIFNTIIFEIDFCRNLIDAELKTEANEKLIKLLDSIPDETVSDLLPQNLVNPVGNENGQRLRIKILDMIIESSKSEESSKYIQKVAQLQPLSPERIAVFSQLKDNENSERAYDILKVLNPGQLFSNIVEQNEYTGKIPEKMYEHFLRHPATRKTGAFYSIQKWLSKLETPDLSIVKSFSEKLNSQDFPEAYNVVNSIQKLFFIPELETYIARGKNSHGIIAFEGTPAFLLIGYDHLKKGGDDYLDVPELQFAIGAELAHLYYNHTRISSNDVWRGAMDKGYLFVDSLVSLVPLAGVIGKSIQNVSRLKSIANLLEGAKKLSTGKELLDSATKLVSFYKKADSSSKNDKDDKKVLLATSRLMQLTADRAGLLFCGNLQAAIRSIFLTSNTFFTELKTVEKDGLMNYILEQNNDNSYKHADLSIRLASLFSFYISNDYFELRKALLAK